MADAPPPMEFPGVDLMDSYGPFLLGVIFYSVLWGISCMQMFLYYLNYETDKVGLKSLVALVWVFDTANVMLTIASLFPVFVTQWGFIPVLSAIQPTLRHHTWVAGIVTVAVQLFFIHRIYRFSDKSIPMLLLLAVMIPCSLWQLGGAFPFVLWLYQATSVDVLSEPRMLGIEISLRVTSAFVDIAVAASMVYLLAKKRHAEFLASRKLIYRMIVLTISTGLWTAIISIIDLGFVVRFPSGLQFTAPEFPLSGLYVNTLLANLNARQFLRSSAGSDAERGGYELDRRTGNSSLRFSSAVPSAGRTTNNVTQDSGMSFATKATIDSGGEYAINLHRGGKHDL